MARLCSETSQVLRGCPTARGRASPAWVLRLPGTAPGAIRQERPRALPVLARGVSVHARGLRPRGAPARLAMATHRIWPSASPYSVGAPEGCPFAAAYPACTYPCPLFAVGRA